MADEMKKCKYCGREIGINTNFCWYCGRELEARPERPEPARSEIRWERWLLVGLAIFAGIVILVGLIVPWMGK